MSYTQNLTLFHIKDSHTTLLQYNYMYLTFLQKWPQCISKPEFPELLSQNLTCYHQTLRLAKLCITGYLLTQPIPNLFSFECEFNEDLL